jgi:hypothetical protein
VYLDNFLSGEVGAEGEFSHNVALQQKALEAWHSTGILTAEDKQVLGSKSVVELRVRIDGINGLVGASSDRIFKTSSAWPLCIIC